MTKPQKIEGGWEKEVKFFHRVNQEEDLIETVKDLLASERQRCVGEERERICLLVDKTKEEIYKLKPIKTAILGDENLDLITKYQAVNMINLNGLPYTPIDQAKHNLGQLK